MIISRTPFRVSLVGGATDLPAFYRKEKGAILGTAIDKYMYITVNHYFDQNIILKYSRTELVPHASKIRHPILRECLRHVGIANGIEITSMADIPGGTGLGSSSSFTVGLLHALYAFKGKFCSAEKLAAEACEIEMVRLGDPVGKQDQYLAAYGGFEFMEFLPNESVRVDPLICPPRALPELHKNLVLLYSGIRRSTGEVLRKAHSGIKNSFTSLRRLRELALEARQELHEGRVQPLGEILHESWLLKKALGSGISNPKIDRAYAIARKNGAIGGKLLGAGGGGFLLLFCPPAKRQAVLCSLPGWREIPFNFEPEGSKIIYVHK